MPAAGHRKWTKSGGPFYWFVIFVLCGHKLQQRKWTKLWSLLQHKLILQATLGKVLKYLLKTLQINYPKDDLPGRFLGFRL
jgi:hypothetical protein